MEQPNLEDPLGSLCLSVHLTSDGRTITLVMKPKPGDTVEAILDLIQRYGGIPVNDKLLFYRGQKLDPHFAVASHIIENNVELHLVDENLREEQPVVWQRIGILVLQIQRLLVGDDGCGSRVKVLQDHLRSFLDMTLKSDSITDELLKSRMSIFQYVCAPALVFLYFSQSQYKMVAEESIRTFLSSCIPTLHSVCAPVVLEFCTMIGKYGSKDDPLYTICRSTLGMLVEDQRIGTCMNESCVVALKDVFPFVTELAELSPPSEVHTFAAFLSPIKAMIKLLGDSDGSTPITTTYADSCAHKEVGQLHKIFLKLVDKMRNCLEVVKNEMEMMDKEDSEWDQYLVIMKEAHGIATLYEFAENLFWSNIKSLDVSLRYLILTYANRGEDYKWIIGQKDLLDFECRKHLLLLMFPDINDEDAEEYAIKVDRLDLLIDSFYEIMEEYPENLRGKLHVEFTDEDATGPGVLREWFILVSQEIFNPDNALFIACPNDRRKFFPNPASSGHPSHHSYFEFAGRLIALAIMHLIPVGIMFDRSFFLQLAGVNISLEDIKDADPDFYSSCKQILDMDPVTVDQDALGLTFVHEFEGRVVELLDNGETTVVNSGNRHEYIQLLIMQRFVTSVAEKVDKFAEGFSDIVGNRETLELFFKTLELEEYNEMLHGSDSIICVEDWKAHTEYHGYTETDPQIYWFWKVVEEMTGVQKRNLLFFWTAMLYLPPAGFGGIGSRLKIFKSNNSINQWPTSNTCFHRLTFPPYPSLEVMRQRLEIITQSSNGFGYGQA